MEENKIIIYQTEDGQTQIDVRLENDMIWLTRQQLADLFGRDYKTISKHINNALKEELADTVVVAKFANTTQHGAIEGKTQTHEKEYFNLEMVTSVGYRVKSKRGVQFRKWANRVLKEYLIKGYAVNERLRKEQIGELRQLVGMLGRTIQNQPLLSNDETNALFEVVTDYTYALDTLDNYDYQRLTVQKTTKEEPFHATYENAMDASGNGFTPDPRRHFAVNAKGDSMLPKIHDGDLCVFEWYRAGSRNGEIVLTECSEKDIDYGGMYTIKKYHSEKIQTEEGWQHIKVELIPLNKDYNVIELDEDGGYRTIGILKCIL